MAPALRMTRIIKEKLPIFFPFQIYIEGIQIWALLIGYNWSYAFKGQAYQISTTGVRTPDWSNKSGVLYFLTTNTFFMSAMVDPYRIPAHSHCPRVHGC
jgi:hypothetical protein